MPVVVVWGARALPEVQGVRQVQNPNWEHGPLSSLQVGLRAVLPSDPSGVLVMTVDRPHVAESTVRALVDAHRNTPNVVVQPRVGESTGHPIVHPRSVVDELLQLAPTDSVRTVIRRPDVRDARVRVSVDDPAVLDNLDTPASLARLIHSSRD